MTLPTSFHAPDKLTSNCVARFLLYGLRRHRQQRRLSGARWLGRRASEDTTSEKDGSYDAQRRRECPPSAMAEPGKGTSFGEASTYPMPVPDTVISGVLDHFTHSNLPQRKSREPKLAFCKSRYLHFASDRRRVKVDTKIFLEKADATPSILLSCCLHA